MEESVLIQLCLKQDYTAQEFLYKKYAPRFLALILRYIPRRDDAEDVLVESVFKIFTKLDTFKKEGSFEGWMKRLVVNDCLMFLRKNKMITVGIDTLNEAKVDMDDSFMEKDVEALKRVIDSLPSGYKIIFNLYVVEGYKHKEIAQLLGISVNTSKSQLIHAKRSIRKQLGLTHLETDNSKTEDNDDE
jgi:RNA polymerase sigma-70 factor (ECF subfamily)